MAEENLNQELRLKNKDETRNYLIQEIDQNELISKNHKKVCTTLNYIERSLVLGSTITRCDFNSAFPSFVGNPIRITSSATRLKICAITTAIKKHKSSQ